MYFLELLGIRKVFPFTLLMAVVVPQVVEDHWNWRRFGVQLQLQFASVVVISSGGVPEQSCH